MAAPPRKSMWSEKTEIVQGATDVSGRGKSYIDICLYCIRNRFVRVRGAREAKRFVLPIDFVYPHRSFVFAEVLCEGGAKRHGRKINGRKRRKRRTRPSSDAFAHIVVCVSVELAVGCEIIMVPRRIFILTMGGLCMRYKQRARSVMIARD